jgi:uncharacterized protein YbaR (Trm112 family)
LRTLDGQTLDKVNAAIATGTVRNHGGGTLNTALTQALVTTDGDLIYPVRNGIPILLEEECIHWAAFHD